MYNCTSNDNYYDSVTFPHRAFPHRGPCVPAPCVSAPYSSAPYRAESKTQKHLTAYSTKNLLFLSCRSGSETYAEAIQQVGQTRVRRCIRSVIHQASPVLSPYCVSFFYSHLSRLLAGMQTNGAETPGSQTLGLENSMIGNARCENVAKPNATAFKLNALFCHQRVRSSVSPSSLPSVGSSVRPSVRPSICPSVRPSFRPSVRLSVRPSVSPSVSSSVRPSVRLPVCSSVRRKMTDTRY